jgi:hypothetical protein
MHSEELDPTWYGLMSQFGINFGAAEDDIDDDDEEEGGKLSCFSVRQDLRVHEK